MRSIRHRAMKPLEPDEEDLERSGWAKVAEPMTTELSYEDVFWNEYVVLSYRTDKWQFPGAMLKARFKEAEAAYLEKKGKPKLSRSEKNELKLLVAKRLRKSNAPATRSFDLAWSLNENVVRFFSHSPKVGAAMSELFDKTFKLRLVPESPYTLAARLGLDKSEEQAWQDLEAICLAEDRVDMAAAAEE